MTNEQIADELERRLADPAYTYTQWATFVEQNLPAILRALREPTAEQVERAAAALAHRHAEPPRLTSDEWWDDSEEKYREAYREDARAALLAARSAP